MYTGDVSYFIVCTAVHGDVNKEGKVEKETSSTRTDADVANGSNKSNFTDEFPLLNTSHVPYKQARANKPC